jgi:hypothetical protein
MTHRILSAKLSLAAFAAAACLAAAPASAVEIGNSNFTLTFPTGWSKLDIGVSDSAAVTAIKSGGVGGTVIMTGTPHAGALTSAEMAAYIAQYSASDSVTVVDQGTKTLGGKAFNFIEFKKADPEDEIEATARYRFYFINQGGYLFQAFSFYNTLIGATAMADIESALGTLRLTPSTSLRAVAGLANPELRPARRDVLGRFQRTEIRKTPLFRRPAL